MADVFKKIITENDYHQGYAIGSADNVGNYESLAPTFNQINGIPAQSGILDTRFDDIRYYS